jgi:CheY-like chemotaxis protein
MGLSTVYGIIKEMKGDISVYSEEGAGSTFRILIPEVISGTQVETDHEEIQLITGKGKILLVDDEMSIIDWTSQVLLKLGYEVITACNGIDAVDQFLKSPSSYDLVLSDLAMPEISGIDLSKRIRMERPDIPIILCTGFSDGLTSDIIQNYGISSMIMKPLIASELSQAISTALDNNSNKD